MIPLTHERLLALLDQGMACPDSACLERVRLAVAGAPAHDVHARMVRDLVAMRARELGTVAGVSDWPAVAVHNRPDGMPPCE
jgi:hypothetical protein